jgi:hypothetical protein
MTILLMLPATPDLDHLKKQAKQLLRDVRALLRRERDVADRLFVVGVWISRQGNRPADRAPDEALILAARNVLVHERAPSRSSSRDRPGVRRHIAQASLRSMVRPHR